MITYFKSLSDTSTPYHKDVSEAVKRIKNGNSRELCNVIRTETDKSRRNELKKSLPAICFSGKFSKRADGSILEHSGFICIDFDGFIDEWAMLDARHKLCSDEYS